MGLTKRAFAAALKVTIAAAIFITTVPIQTSALSASDFKPGNIIDDAVFFQGDSMTAPQIQEFLDAKMPNCAAGSTCMKSLNEVVTGRPAEANLCNEVGFGPKSAAQIIYEVGAACGISQKALLVLLEKEQSLVTDKSPSATQYKSATGFACPDTAPCDAKYYGFFNQVYSAARQFKYYALHPQKFGYKAGQSQNIGFNPKASCGSSSVHIQNQATAGLYIYTPYQPNQAALGNIEGSGDNCSAYGNRNFWRTFIAWFGSTSVLAPIATITANTQEALAVPENTLVGVSWTSARADSCEVSGLNKQTPGGDATVTITTSRTYTLTCRNPAGVATDSVTLTASPVPSAVVLVNGAKNSTVKHGETIELSWQLRHLDNCTINGHKLNTSINGYSEAVYKDTTYALACVGPSGPVSDSVGVEVLPEPAKPKPKVEKPKISLGAKLVRNFSGLQRL